MPIEIVEKFVDELYPPRLVCIVLGLELDCTPLLLTGFKRFR